MNSYGLIDLHCDTLADWKYANTGNPDTLDDPGRVLQLSNMPNDVHWAQFYAVFIPDEERGDAAIAYFEKNRINFYRQMEKFSDRVAPCRNAADMEKAAQTISEKYGCAVLCKGGHQINDADDLLWRNSCGKWFRGKRIANPNTHGTGCTLSSAIASNLAKGYDLDASVERAKAYISGCLSAMLDLGHGSGPMDHMFALKGEFVGE